MGRARPGHLGVIRARSCLFSAPPGAWQGPAASTQLESQAAPAQEAGRDLRSAVNSALAYPLGIQHFP